MSVGVFPSNPVSAEDAELMRKIAKHDCTKEVLKMWAETYGYKESEIQVPIGLSCTLKWDLNERLPDDLMKKQCEWLPLCRFDADESSHVLYCNIKLSSEHYGQGRYKLVIRDTNQTYHYKPQKICSDYRWIMTHLHVYSD